jgi:class 3 adenylate cyclase
MASTQTFLFSDIEGSTRLLRQLKGGYSDVLAEHQRLLREAFAAESGDEINTQGDSFFYSFPIARNGVAAAAAAQRSLAAHAWPEGVDVRVRMGLHTEERGAGDDPHAGLGVHKTARIAAAAHGGQVLLSSTTRGLVEDDLPAGLELRDLGEHRLKDLEWPEQLTQLVVAGLPDRFPSLNAVSGPAAVSLGPLLRIRLTRPAWLRRR